MKKLLVSVCLLIVLLAQASLTQTITETFGTGANQFAVDFVRVGNSNNTSDPLTGKGSVSYEYNISKYEITQNQIIKAINSGVQGINYPGGGWSGNQPASVVNWYQAAIFVNYLNLSQGYHIAYDLSWAPSASPWGQFSMNLWSKNEAWSSGGENLFRHKDTQYFLPSENEWYKAAYFSPTLNSGTGGYWLYPTQENMAPIPVTSGSSGAVYDTSVPAEVQLSGAESFYGTVGQGGNVVERTESSADGVNDDVREDRVSLGGSYFESGVLLASTTRQSHTVEAQFGSLGFRVAGVPEPSALSLLAVGLGGLAMIRRRRS